MKSTFDIEKIQKLQCAFAKTRDWDQFHNPKNLSMALTSDAGELLELFQWLEAEPQGSVGNYPSDRTASETDLRAMTYDWSPRYKQTIYQVRRPSSLGS